MKKYLLILFTALFIAQGSVFADTTSEAANLLNSLKNAVVQDVKNTVSTTLNKGVNVIKIANYKSQLEQKKQELKELEESNTNFFVKFFKRISINRQINQLEADIKTLEETK